VIVVWMNFMEMDGWLLLVLLSLTVSLPTVESGLGLVCLDSVRGIWNVRMKVKVSR
jgi:hypothetical protein